MIHITNEKVQDYGRKLEVEIHHRIVISRRGDTKGFIQVSSCIEIFVNLSDEIEII